MPEESPSRRYRIRSDRRLGRCRAHMVTRELPANVPEGPQDRSLARSAWDSTPQTSRPVGYGMIGAGLRTDFTTVEVFSDNQKRLKLVLFAFLSCLTTRRWRVQRRCLAGSIHYIEQQLEHHRTRIFQEEYLAFLRTFRRKIPLGLGAPHHTVPYGTVSF
jgi:hypothetical protein